MIVTKKIVPTYVVEMTEDQRNLLIAGVAQISSYANKGLVVLTDDNFEVLNDLRLSLING